MEVVGRARGSLIILSRQALSFNVLSYIHRSFLYVPRDGEVVEGLDWLVIKPVANSSHELN